MKMNATERAELRNQIRTTRANLAAVVEVFQATRNDTPAATVAALVDRLGYDTARETVAELVNTVGTWDGRIYDYVREWADSVETAATREELEARGIYQPSEIHPAHINQIGQAMREYVPAQPAEATEEAQPAANRIESIRSRIESAPARSAWDRGVKAYASELLDKLYEADPDELNRDGLERAMLNGAHNWSEYSWGGCSLIYDSNIAARLCTPSELKRTENGKRRPNRREEWLDVQARALYQAARLICRTAAALPWGEL